MRIKIILLFAMFLVTHAITYGQKTEISVQEGKVIAQTTGGTVTVEAGRKAILTQDENPNVTVDDPMVDDLLKMYEWAEAERAAGKIRIDSVSIQILSLDSETRWKGVGLNESPNGGSEPGKVCSINGTMILDDPKYYDLDGNLLAYKLEKISSTHGNYHLTFPVAVEPGDKFRYIIVSEVTASLGLWNDGLFWHHVMENNPRYCVNYFRVILPETAVFIDSSRDIVAVDSIDGRVAVTTRNYTGKNARGMVHTKFLWPGKDGTNIADLSGLLSTVSGSTVMELTEGATEVVKKLDSVPWDKSGKEVVSLYEEFTRGEVSLSDPWFTLGIKLVGGGHWEQAFDSFEQCVKLSKEKMNPDYISALIWQGHVYDVWGKRDEAIVKYEVALMFLEQFKNAPIISDFENLVFMRHDQWGIKLSYKWVKNRIEEPFTERMLRINAPTEEIVRLKERFDALPWDNGGQEVVDFYEECVNNSEITGKSDFGSGWVRLGIKLVGAAYWDEAFDSFVRGQELTEQSKDTSYFAALVWQGHIYDVRGQREEAIEKYKAALAAQTSGYMRHDQWGIVLNYKWVKERLETPFTKEMIGK